MLKNITGFELKYQIPSPLFVAVFAIFFLLTFGGVTIDQVQVGSTSAVNVNSPHAITMNLLIWSIFGMFIPTAFLVSGILRDAAYKTEELFYSSPVKERDYLIGRFVGGFIATALVFVSVPLAFIIGSVMPWLDPDSVGPMVWNHYFYTYFTLAIPNLLISGMIFFTVANFTRSNVATYTALVALLVAYFTGLALLNQPEWRTMVALADPFGINAYGEMVRYWTPAELNTQVVPFEGVFLQNRIIWTSVALGLFLLNLLTFSFRKRASFLVRLFHRKRKPEASTGLFVPREISIPVSSPHLELGSQWRQFGARVWFEVKGVVKNVAFWILLALGILNSIGGLLSLGAFYGTEVYPVTRVMIDVLQGSFSIIPMIVVIYYGAELVWRERNEGFSEIVDATPVPNWAFVFSKYVAMNVVLIGLFGVSILTAMGVQLIKGYTNLEIEQYVIRLLIDFGIPFMMIAALSLFAQVITNNKWIGMLIMVVFIISQLVLTNMGYEHNLYQFGGSPGAPYSDMNGYGHFLGISLWFYLYWGFVSVLLLVVSYLLWNRGSLRSLVGRLRALPTSLTKATASIALVCILGAGIVGSWIFYNTNVLNDYVTQQDIEKQTALYETRYEHLADVPQPKVTNVVIDVDIFPYERRYEARGEYKITNITDVEIGTVYMGYNPGTTIRSQAFEGASLSDSDEDLRFYTFELEDAMQPGEVRTFTFEVAQLNPGFRNSGNGSSARYNGTFFNNGEAMPGVGYNDQAILIDPQARRRQDLEPADRAPKLEIEDNWYIGAFGKGADFVSFKTTVSTVEDQIAIAPGYLNREWTENGRRYFEYEMDSPIFNFYAWLSGEYEVARDDWKGLPLEIYYHPGHEYNLDVMMKGMKDSLEYFSKNFSPYQHRQARIIEFPAYANFAQSFSNTIPYSEGIGFIADLRDPEDIDVVYYVTAHEIAHQWWAHQAVPANVQGAAMPSESFSQYSALMVMEKEYGPNHMRRFLKYELDNYLTQRGGEIIEEMPLYKVENQQYIHYQKGSLVMYALKDYMGEETVNRVLAKLLDERAFSADPFTTSLDFIRILRAEVGPEWEYLISDLFEKIVLFDFEVKEADARKLEDGTWEVTMDIEAHMYEADGQGAQTEVPLDYWVDVGIFTKDLNKTFEGSDHVLKLEKHQINETEMTFTFVVGEEPLYVGIDPYNKLIDRNSDNNLKKISITSGESS